MSIRTNNFQLRMATLKNSLRLFMSAVKYLYLNLVVDHLFDWEYLLPPFFKELMQEMWVIKTETTHSFVALDEYVEMKHNIYLKRAVQVF